MNSPDIVHQSRVLQKGIGNKLGPERITGHQDGFGEIAGIGRIMWSRHIIFPSFFSQQNIPSVHENQYNIDLKK